MKIINIGKTCKVNDFTPSWLGRQIGIPKVTTCKWARGASKIQYNNQEKVIKWLKLHNFKIIYGN